MVRKNPKARHHATKAEILGSRAMEAVMRDGISSQPLSCYMYYAETISGIFYFVCVLSKPLRYRRLSTFNHEKIALSLINILLLLLLDVRVSLSTSSSLKSWLSRSKNHLNGFLLMWVNREAICMMLTIISCTECRVLFIAFSVRGSFCISDEFAMNHLRQLNTSHFRLALVVWCILLRANHRILHYNRWAKKCSCLPIAMVLYEGRPAWK